MSETQTLTLADFLLSRIAEDEAAAKAAGGEWWMPAQVPGPTMRKTPNEPTETIIDSPSSLITYAVARDEFAEHIARHDPARVLAECEAKRRIVEEWDAAHRVALASPQYSYDEGIATGLLAALYALALPYADHPDFRAEWAL